MSEDRRAVAMSRTFRALTAAAACLPATVDECLILDWPHPVMDEEGTMDEESRCVVSVGDGYGLGPQIVASHWIGDHTWACFYRHSDPDALVAEVRDRLAPTSSFGGVEVVALRRDRADGAWGMLP